MSQIQGILFDKDGTLFDFNATWAVWAKDVLTELARGDETMLAALGDAVGFDPVAVRFHPSSLVIAGTALEIAEALAAVLNGPSDQEVLEQMNHRAASAPQVEVTPLRPFFSSLKLQGLAVGVATNDGEMPAKAHLERAGILDEMDFVAGSDSGYGGKPAAGQLTAFCSKLGLKAGRCLMVGDSTHDLIAGRAAGFGTVGVLTGPARREVLAPLADIVLNSIAELPEYLPKLNR